jgi:hypothetical protein
MRGWFTVPAKLPKVGQVVCIDDEDYVYGVGQLTFYITSVGPVETQQTGPWVKLTGYRVKHGTTWGGKRDITARVSGCKPVNHPLANEPLPRRVPDATFPSVQAMAFIRQ